MDLSFLNNLRKITDEDDRLVTITLLIDITSNLISDRNNHRYHTLPICYIREMFQKYTGAMQCLHTIGFKQINDDYVFDQTISDKQLQEIVKLLENELDPKPIDKCEQVKCNSLDLGITDNDRSSNSLISFDNFHVSSHFNKLIPFVSILQRVQSYEDINLQHYIRSKIIPLEDFNRRISKKMKSTDINKRDLLLLELLRWFKEEFFTWFDRANCDYCKKPMDFAEYTQATREEREYGDAHRVELYRCSTCSSEYRFPRFNAPIKLLETRSGRCGEAANLFACLCRSLSFLTRYIYDPSDHVWTEVYSESEQRWLHCDSCENLCDSPLVYEKGWKKELTFCIAFAKDHIGDVTWRYVTNFKQIIQRRNINEKNFARTIHQINRKIQSQLNQEEKIKIISNQIKDIVSMLNEEKSAKESELHGRQSGSLGWKLSRGETDQQDDFINGYVYSITNEECEKGSIQIEYNSVVDKYLRNGIEEIKKDGWIDRVYSCSNIQRKIEKDWKMVYLCREHLHTNGVLSWTIQLKPEEEKFYQFHHITIQCPSKAFDQYTQIICQLQIDDKQIIDLSQNLSSNSLFEYSLDNKLDSLTNIRITFKVILNCSNDNNDNNAWQKGQLCRQSTDQVSNDDQSHYLRLHATIRKRNLNL
ncbi:unnamed protein product [Adineta steineri]|uniref:Peptide-N(4)-(N-acetyl-beta-glucosaminyl)asparagine amidase n=1 Tax=Adineta steineri TaxID=433720 RepID=A0A815J1C1_9BILA|nr:unnamed protein product [Adineta steineri]CAF3878848.1 unnamed protein product [Adineta steineri]